MHFQTFGNAFWKRGFDPKQTESDNATPKRTETKRNESEAKMKTKRNRNENETETK